ncbi:zinc finger CCCH domain-containing protein 37-like isoform X1 [Phalaenopsis equestris]|uniref:zinc finger CCCH domain-containing protein 37-like isoform X1 n=1 Tax=Phalaenopsis equestris TaxID=78828 RepID=UPI0009E2534B|nr:zinc finger CCCH domain-containing protein 37-like isoform X1 [Phalaenopsis equestris]
MAKQIYYSTTFPGGTGTVYSLYGAEPYLPVAVGSSRYATDGTALTGVGERASYVYTTQNNGLMAPGTEIPSVGVYSAGNIGAGLTTLPSIAVDGLGVTTTVNAESKRSAEALYNQSILAHSTIGPSDALLSTYSLAKRPKLVSSSYLPMYPQRPGEKDCVHYMLTRTCKFGEACKFDHPVWVPEGGIPDWKEVPLIPTSESLPERPGEPDCPYFLKTQTCKYGSKCKFNHPREKLSASITVAESIEFPFNSELPERPSEAVCTFYAKTGKCKFGANCKFHHPKGIQIQSAGKDTGYPEKNESTTYNADAAKTFVSFSPAFLHNSKGLPIRPGEAECPFYLKTGSCKYGATCRYSHPDRVFINPTHTANLNNAILTPAVASYPLGVVNPAATFLPTVDPRLAQVGVTVYPQRPGEIECDYYMRTGHCKFGERCRFHHPVDRSIPNATSAKQPQESVKLTLAGLPRREGSVACPFYMKTGICKYGVACRFDHPPPGEAVAMAQVTSGTAEASNGDRSGEEEEDEEDTGESSE